MHVIDAATDCCGGESHGHDVRFACQKCGYETEWIAVRSVSEGKLGIPCPKCNQ